MRRAVVPLLPANRDIEQVAAIGGKLRRNVLKIAAHLATGELPFPDSLGHHDHELYDNLYGFNGVSVFRRGTIWFDTNHPAGSLRTVYSHCFLPDDFQWVYFLISEFPGVVSELERAAEDFGVESWEDLNEVVFVLCLCRGYHKKDKEKGYAGNEYADDSGYLKGCTTAFDLLNAGFSLDNPRILPAGYRLKTRSSVRRRRVSDSVRIYLSRLLRRVRH